MIGYDDRVRIILKERIEQGRGSTLAETLSMGANPEPGRGNKVPIKR